MSAVNTRFLFDTANLISFCKKLDEQDFSTQAESLIEIKMKDIDFRWEKVGKSYEDFMLSKQDESLKTSAQEQYDACVDSYYKTVSRMLNVIKPVRNSELRDSMPPFQGNAANNDYNTGLKLPPCDTEVFAGGYEDWPAFRDMFTAVYINHPRLTPAERLYHLRNKTTDTAGAIVKRFPLTDDNFELAWQALKLRYENVRVLVDNQIRNLFNIPVAVEEDSESLQRIHSAVSDCLSMLQSLGVSVIGWDPILVNLVYSKLPHETLAQWEQSLNASRELPKWSQLSDFLLKRCEVVERISTIQLAKSVFAKSAQQKVQIYSSQEKLHYKCKMCDEDHSLRICPQFRKLSIQERVDFIFKNQFCNNCLSQAHSKKNCSSKNSCLNCGKKHHTMLHMRSINNSRKSSEQSFPNRHAKPFQIRQADNLNNSANVSEQNEPADRPSTSKAKNFAQINSNYAANNTNVLLRTALVQLECRGELFTLRALIDPGSERTFLSEKIRNRLSIPSRKSHFEIVGIGGQSQNAEKECDLILVSKINDFRFQITAIVLPKVTNQIPAQSFNVPDSAELSNLDLADPYFNLSAGIDLVLGNDSERFINLDGIKRNVCGFASAYKTIFGWVLSGPVQTQPVFSLLVSERYDDSRLDTLIKKFWEQEEIPSIPPMSAEDEYCENYYKETTQRLADGRYMVRLPFRHDYPEHRFLGPSRFVALSQYTRMEQTLSKDTSLKTQYNENLLEYISLGHMEETTSREHFFDGKCTSFYLPHHAVVKPESKSTKVRVVFNASRKTKSGFSLNDVLYTGPTLQNDLMITILNWRLYRFVFNGDIQKMYRQILVDPKDRPFQRIIFQKTPQEAVKDYTLKTVTFGINCAPFLAIRTLLQLASDCEKLFPRAATILRNETYVDDILSGSHSIESAIEAQHDLIKALESAGFLLKKITANDLQLLNTVPKEDLYDSNFLKFYDTSATKTLGIRWNALTDSFTYAYEPVPQTSEITKRRILSSVAKLFDPAGWISPIIIKSKILIQQLWLEQIDWDDPVSASSLRTWQEIIQDLPRVEEIQIPRWIQFTPADTVQIHGFCDASKLAYCAAVYVRVQTSSCVVFSNLVVSKSKVAPLASITLPRLELSGAVELAKLVKHITSSMNFKTVETILWCDSSIVLGWLAKPPATWKEIYVSNRIGQIHQLLPDAKWRYVPTHCNPADLGSRGCRPQDLIHNCLWWHGPTWLINPPSEWPQNKPSNVIKTREHENPETQKIESATVPISSFKITVSETDLLKRFSSYTRALRVMAYVFRFVRRFRPSFASPTFPLLYTTTKLSQKEMNSVKTRLITVSQQQHYQTEYESLSKSKPIPNRSSLYTLNPFIDDKGILRVNGRLANSSLPYNERFPIILPRESQLCHLYLSHLHNILAHGECNLMCRMVQTEFYIPRLKLRVKKIIRYCKICIIHKKQSCSQIMAALPHDRCTLSFPFNITGVDFAGPFELKISTLRNTRSIKGYACIFVCFATKAVHLEACSSLSTPAFQAAFSRFVGRRGLPQKLVSDNGRNFVGASRAMRKEFRLFINSVSTDIAQKYITQNFEWSFIPPQAPHMGGLWESAVKSFKFHLKRIAGAHRFNFEEFSTVLARIEGVLNSRPISALSEDPSDLTVLTPGHFLRGGPMLALPEQSYDNLSLINRWEKIKAIHHQFAVKWKEEYLKSLHKRYKWKLSAPNLKEGDFVIIMDDQLPPCEWRLGRIKKVHNGPDKNVRVVEVHTTAGTITRPITKLCFLPFCNEPNINNGHDTN